MGGPYSQDFVNVSEASKEVRVMEKEKERYDKCKGRDMAERY